MRTDNPCSSYFGPEYRYRVVYKLHSGDYHLTTPVKNEKKALEQIDFFLACPDRYEYAYAERIQVVEWERI